MIRRKSGLPVEDSWGLIAHFLSLYLSLSFKVNTETCTLSLWSQSVDEILICDLSDES